MLKMLCVDKRAPMNITFSRLWWLSLISVVEYLLEPLRLETAYWVLITLLLTRVSKSTNMECQLDSIKIYKFLLFIHMYRNCMLSVNDWKGHSALSFLRKLFDNYCMRGLCPSSFYFFTGIIAKNIRQFIPLLFGLFSPSTPNDLIFIHTVYYQIEL